MSKILLINPLFNISKASYKTSINMGLLCLASYLNEHNIQVKIVDCIRQKDYLELIKSELFNNNIDLIGLSVTIMQVGSALEISKIIKNYNSNIPIVWGGAQASLFPKQVAENPLVDAVVIGEGEKTLLELINAFKNKQDLDNILNIAFKKNNKIIINNKREFLKAEELSLLNWSLMPKEILENISLIPTHTSRGCPHQCSFCINSITKNYWRSYPAEIVLQDLEKTLRLPCFKNKPLRFWDEDFFVDINRARKIVQGIIDKKLNIQWETTVRADYISQNRIDNNFLSLLKKSGCYLLSFGAESGSVKVLKQINKGISPEQIINSAKQVLNNGIIPQYSFMVGLPGETKKDIYQTIYLIDKLTSLSPDVQILGPQAFRPYPGSELYKMCVSSGWQTPQTLEGWDKMAKDELNYLSPRNFPWVKNVDLVESLEAYVRFGAHTIQNAFDSTVKSNKLLKLLFILICKIRWEFKFFKWPIEFKLAKKIIVKT